MPRADDHVSVTMSREDWRNLVLSVRRDIDRMQKSLSSLDERGVQRIARTIVVQHLTELVGTIERSTAGE